MIPPVDSLFLSIWLLLVTSLIPLPSLGGRRCSTLGELNAAFALVPPCPIDPSPSPRCTSERTRCPPRDRLSCDGRRGGLPPSPSPSPPACCAADPVPPMGEGATFATSPRLRADCSLGDPLSPLGLTLGPAAELEVSVWPARALENSRCRVLVPSALPGSKVALLRPSLLLCERVPNMLGTSPVMPRSIPPCCCASPSLAQAPLLPRFSAAGCGLAAAAWAVGKTLLLSEP